MGGYSPGRGGGDDSPPARDGPDNIPTGSGDSDTPGVGVMGDILSPVLPAGLRLLMPWEFFHNLNCIHYGTVVE